MTRAPKDSKEAVTRPIKFRAWDAEKNHMAYQGTPDLETIKSFFFHWGDGLLMQYIGMNDKNGRGIYEGDIVRCRGYYKETVYEVIWNRNSSGFAYKQIGGTYQRSFTDPMNPGNWEVLGNIHEGPELVKP